MLPCTWCVNIFNRTDLKILAYFQNKDDSLAANAFLEEAEVRIFDKILIYKCFFFSTISALSKILRTKEYKLIIELLKKKTADLTYNCKIGPIVVVLVLIKNCDINNSSS